LGQDNLKNFIRSGKGFVGIHAAADTEYDWPWYGRLVGAYFQSHPEGTPKATIHTTSNNTFFTSHLEKKWEIEDEWYNYNFRNLDIIPLLMLDENTYEGGINGNNHPITWYHEFEGGKSFYTGLGHQKETYEDARFQKLLENGILYAINRMQ
jgi:type 1 glutamine amidotransferase